MILKILHQSHRSIKQTKVSSLNNSQVKVIFKKLKSQSHQVKFKMKNLMINHLMKINQKVNSKFTKMK